MPKKIYITNDTLQSIKRKNTTAVNRLRQVTQNLRTRSYRNSTSAVDCANAPSNSSDSSCYSGPLHEKFTKQQNANVKKGKKQAVLVGRATVPITPQMIRVAVKELQTRRAYINSSLISQHLQRSYPIESDPNALEEELYEKLNCAVCVGLITKCGDDKYCIPTLRQQANMDKTAITAFWDTYYGSSIPPTMRKFSTLGALRVKANKKRRDITPNCNSGSISSNNFEYFERKAT